jgi:hypothetical protein
MKIYDEYKDCLITSFQHLEANGKQLRQNNAEIETRVNLNIICCDQKEYTIEGEAKKLLKKKPENMSRDTNREYLIDMSAESIKSKAKQVKSRTYILNWSAKEWSLFRDTSQNLTHIQKLMRKETNKLYSLIPGNEPESVDCQNNEIFQLWNTSINQSHTKPSTWGLFLTQHAAWGTLLLQSLEAVVNKKTNGVEDGTVSRILSGSQALFN